MPRKPALCNLSQLYPFSGTWECLTLRFCVAKRWEQMSGPLNSSLGSLTIPKIDEARSRKVDAGFGFALCQMLPPVETASTNIPRFPFRQTRKFVVKEPVMRAHVCLRPHDVIFAAGHTTSKRNVRRTEAESALHSAWEILNPKLDQARSLPFLSIP